MNIIWRFQKIFLHWLNKINSAKIVNTFDQTNSNNTKRYIKKKNKSSQKKKKRKIKKNIQFKKKYNANSYFNSDI